MNLLTSPSDTVAVVCLMMSADYEALGFLPRASVEEAYVENRIILQRQGREVYGYLLHGPIYPGRMVTVKQAFVDTDVRRVGFGLLAFSELVGRARAVGAVGVRLRCAEDLAANAFWERVGCRRVATLMHTIRGWRHISGPGVRRRALHVYEYLLRDTFLAPADGEV